MVDHPILLTEEGLAKLEQELEHLKHVRRPEVAERIRQSKELASTQNNAEFDDAKNEQAFVEGRILTLEKLIQDASIIDEDQAAQVDLHAAIARDLAVPSPTEGLPGDTQGPSLGAGLEEIR